MSTRTAAIPTSAPRAGAVISLCDLTGNMVKPWAEAGHRCVCYDNQHSIRRDRIRGNIVYRWGDVRGLTVEQIVEDAGGEPSIAFAFPPCTHGAGSGSRDWPVKGLQGAIDWLQTFEACRRLVACLRCAWMIEQPVIDKIITQRWHAPNHRFHPWQYGESYQKLTQLWTGGGFVMPSPTVIVKPAGITQDIWLMSPGDDRSDLRSATPQKFARAVFEANSLLPAKGVLTNQ